MHSQNTDNSHYYHAPSPGRPRAQGNFKRSLLFGTLAMVLVGFLWNLITYLMGFELDEIGELLAIVIGLGVRMGYGSSLKFGILAGVLAVLSAIFHRFLAEIDFSRLLLQGKIGEVLPRLDLWDEFLASFAAYEFLDVFFICAGIGLAYHFGRVRYE